MLSGRWMMPMRKLTLALALVVTITALACGADALDEVAMNQDGMVPTFEVDPFWPKPLPNHWIMGATIGADVDSRDHVWLVQRNTEDQFAARTELGSAQDPPVSEYRSPAPPVLEFDPDGNLVGSWGGPTDTGEWEWPTSNHGITVDHNDNVWIGGNGPQDAHIVKFSRNGDFLAQYGTSGARAPEGGGGATADSHAEASFGRVAKIFVDGVDNEAYISDGYLNRRVAVLDASTGELKRYWGAYGDLPDATENPGRYVPGETPPQEFRPPVHCAELPNARLMYVFHRPSNRISVFQTDGTFVKEAIIAPATLSQGSTWDIDFSHDEDQRFIYLADGQNMKVYIIERESLEILYSFGDGGRQPGLFFAVHSLAVDSEGNIYTTETYEGKRIQKFKYMGMGSVPAGDMGAAWPADRRRGG
jgi:hypothetical protein